ncbi:XYL2 [Symbiodinium natans]|uniref:XYL2 protein n=1 Tax=Symbiodinium natans TaxID=878477 RepID=A0A812T5T4_9DINO|nr:XYL2 [Symbiodinium natans]
MQGRREELRSFAQERGVSFTGEVYFRPVHRMPAYENSAAASAHLPVTDDLCLNHVCPPLYPELRDEDVDYVCDVMSWPGFLHVHAAAVASESESFTTFPEECFQCLQCFQCARAGRADCARCARCRDRAALEEAQKKGMHWSNAL